VPPAAGIHQKIRRDFRATAIPWPAATFNLLTRILKSGIWKSARIGNSNSRRKEKTNATESRFLDETNRNSPVSQSSRRLKLHEQTRNCTNEPKFAAFRKIANCSPKPGVLCELSTHAARPSSPKLHEQTPPPMPTMVSPRSRRSKDFGFCLQPNGFPRLGLFRTFAQSSPTHTFRATSPSPVTPHNSAPPPSYGRIDPSCRI
jgi:hypothetical protein